MLQEKIEESNKSEYAGGNSGWFKMKEGKNQFRVLSEPEPIFEDFKKGICYHQCGFTGTPKYLSRVLDRADNKVKLYKIPFSIFKIIAGWEQDEDLMFTGFPMPYDVKVTAKNAGTKEVEYVVMPSPKQVPVDQETLNFLTKQKSLKVVIEKMQEKNIEKHKEDGSWQKQQEHLANLKEELEAGRNIQSDEDLEIPEGDIPF